jgi:alpha-tubulin suppressor-like RCC1 family protein
MKHLACLLTFFAFFTVLPLVIQAQTLDWGWNNEGNLGLGNFNQQPNPQTVTAVPDAVGIGGGGSHTVFLKSNGTLVAAGRNEAGQLGAGGVSDNYIPNPIPVIFLTDIIQVSGGGLHSAALRSDGTVWSWGMNFRGQLGFGATTTTGCQCVASPTQSAISDVVQVEAGFYHTLALKSDGTVWAWGWNQYGQLGDNSITDRPTPVQVGSTVAGFTNIIAVSAGSYHSMALKSDGTVWVWGNNQVGQIGNGSTSGAQLMPVQNTTLTNVSQISSGLLHSFARRTDGTVWIWGNNGYGQVGNGTAVGNQLTPVQNVSMANVVEISANDSYHNLVRLRDGSVRAWGFNDVSLMGDGSTTNTGCQCKSTPVTSLVGTGNALIANGTYSGFALKPSFTTPTGTNVIARGENVRLFFDNVTTAGTTAYTSIDPTTTGLTVPANYTIQDNAPAYNITSTAVTSGNIDVCLEVQSEFNQTAFSLLKILHEEGGALIDRTFSSSFIQREICARVSSFSRFVVAQRLAPTAANVSISGQVLNAKTGIGRVTVSLTDSSGNTRTTVTNSFGKYYFGEVPAGQVYVISVNHKKYVFNPDSQVLNISEAVENVDFSAVE